jgi:hypothetical protein
MTARDFAYWLQGYFELSDAKVMAAKATAVVKAHLNLVFKHEIDPSMGDEKHQKELNDIHFINGNKGEDDGLARC